MSGFSGIVVDDFYSDSRRIRKAALGLKYIAPNPKGLGGLAWRCDVPVSKEVVAGLEKAWGFKIKPSRAEIRYTLESADEISQRRGIICHSDAGVSEFTAVIYLSRPQDCIGGTAFFEHKPSGSKVHDLNANPVDFRAINDWREYHCSDMKFNRLVTYPSNIFHGIKRPFFGKDIKSSRMIQSIRFDRA